MVVDVKNSKAGGVDEVTGEMVRYNGDLGHNLYSIYHIFVLFSYFYLFFLVSSLLSYIFSEQYHSHPISGSVSHEIRNVNYKDAPLKSRPIDSTPKQSECGFEWNWNWCESMCCLPR